MAFLDIEKSEHDGQPQEFYRFEYLDTSWLYTPSQDPVTIDGDEFTRAYIKRSPLKNDGDVFSTTLTVTVRASNPVALLFRSWKEDTVLLTLYRKHVGSDDVFVVWSGKVASSKFNKGKAALSCLPLYTSLKKLGLNRVYQRGCPHVQYQGSCGLTAEEWEEETTITGLAGNICQIDAAITDNYLAGSRITVGVERRWVTGNVGSTITMVAAFSDVKVGDTAIILPGCRHDPDVCKSKFDNLLNNGGFFFIPSKNPFNVSLLG